MSCSVKKIIRAKPSDSKNVSKGMYEQTTEFRVCSVYPNIFQLETVEKNRFMYKVKMLRSETHIRHLNTLQILGKQHPKNSKF